MSSIIWSFTNGGAEITANVDHGGVSNGVSSVAQEFFIRHTYVNPITDAKVYARAVSGTYSGAKNAAADLSEILGWGNQAAADDFGGLIVNMDATSGYDDDWPDVDNPLRTYSHVVKTGQGDSELNAVALLTSTGCAIEGTVPAGSTPNVRFKVRFDIPTNEGTLGIRQVEQVLRYDYTS